MPVHNAEVAAVFEEMADLLEIKGSNPFRTRASRNAARTLRDLPREVGAMLDEGEDLTELPGIGEDLAAKIKEVVQTGTAAALEAHRKKVQKTLTELLRIPGIGPKWVKALYHDLGVRTLDQLQKAAQDGLVRSLQGFGEKTERYILSQLKERDGEEMRSQLAVATPTHEQSTLMANRPRSRYLERCSLLTKGKAWRYKNSGAAGESGSLLLCPLLPHSPHPSVAALTTPQFFAHAVACPK